MAKNSNSSDKVRCGWGSSNDIYMEYHDNEWGVPLHDEIKLFEFLVLESFQSGLSWITILKKRKNFIHAFEGFDPNKVALFSETKVQELMQDTGIVRNRRKIEAAINNAKRFLEIQEEFGSFDKYIWAFVDFRPIINKWKDLSEMPAKTNLSDTIAADMKKRGFKFIGSTVIYSHMQATGMMNDHVVGCFRYEEIKSYLIK